VAGPVGPTGASPAAGLKDKVINAWSAERVEQEIAVKEYSLT